VGALIGGLYALWQAEAKREARPNGKTMAARSRTKHLMRMDGETSGRAKTNGGQLSASGRERASRVSSASRQFRSKQIRMG
jgi:hypothetical protein